MFSGDLPELSDEQWEPEEGGLFGKWVLDEKRLPAYEYTYLDRSKPEAGIKEDHWHQVGNDRFTAEAHAGGWFVPYRWEHGLTRLAPNNPQNPGRLAGVGSLKKSSGQTILTMLHNHMPDGSPWIARWGEGYAEWETEKDGVKVKRRITAPFGDDPILVVDVEIAASDAGAEYEYEERWVVEPYAITLPAPMTKSDYTPSSKTASEKIVWKAVTGISGAVRKAAELYRGAYSKMLAWDVKSRNSGNISIAYPRLRHLLPLPAPGRRSWRDLYPQPVFMAAGRQGNSASVKAEIDSNGVIFSGSAKFKPSAESPSKFRFIFGWGNDREFDCLVEEYGSGDLPGWSEHVPRVSVSAEPWVEREMSWHGSYLRSMLVMDDYYENHLLPQASAYGYLHGIHGAPRDYALAAVPMIYLSPQRAREMLLQMMRLVMPSGEMIYGHGGYGMTSSAVGIHAAPTDLPIFLMWTIVEYLGATGDAALLDERVPFYPKEDGLNSTVRERIELAWYYLQYKVGKGPHGLLRVGTGDWNDPISLMVPSHSAFVKRGESCFNTAFAVHVLPKMANIVESWDERTAKSMRQFAGSLSDSLKAAWTGEWYLRGYDGRGGPIGEDRLFLDSNAWCLISGVGGVERMKTLSGNIGSLLDDPSPIGATILDKPVKVRLGALTPGWDCNGGVWAAINGLLAWGYSLYDPERAWQNLYKQSLAAHARAYPHVWFGIWSGPDAYNAHYAERAGETFIHPVTPMQEYPVMNSNAHALPLLGLIKIAGIEPEGMHLRIKPRMPEFIESWNMDMPLIKVRGTGGSVTADYNKIEGFNFPRAAISK